MKKKFLFYIIILFTSMLTSQEVYVGTGLGSAIFDEYVNSTGINTLDNAGFRKPKKALFEVGILFNLYKEKAKFDLGFNYNTYQINTSFYSGNLRIPTQYNLSYASAKAGFSAKLLRYKKLILNIHSHYSYNWLTFGTNEYADVFVDLVKDETLDDTLWRFHRGFGLEYEISDKISVYSNYDFATSFKENNEDSNSGEKYVLNTNAFTVGILFEINKKNN
ncbi:hypothetical protein [uncultured Polaribacter sp.]|uniref:hypothetical protein n=1 Tax=uncultured Polaribacter sp. TaxID=174711 RepID=UPI00263769BB|nr:hypothetical protein [uncultured Polaribacter sp.]